MGLPRCLYEPLCHSELATFVGPLGNLLALFGQPLGIFWETSASPKSTLIQCERVTWGRRLGIDQKLTNSRELIEWASQGAREWATQ